MLPGNNGTKEGLHVYIGTTGTGKTHKAIRDAIALAGTKRQGLLVVDSRGADNLQQIPLVTSWIHLRDPLYREGRIVRIVPKDETEFEKVMADVERCGNVIVLIDEFSAWSTNPIFLGLCRVWRHRKISLFLTTQKVGRDVQQTVLACDPTLYVFRTTSPTSLEWLERWHSLDPKALRVLGIGEFYTLTF